MTEEGATVERASRGAAGMVALSVLAAALVLAVIALIPKWRAVDHTQGRDQAVLAAARQSVVNMLTIDQADPKGSVDRVASGATGEFKQQLESQSDQFTGSLRAAQAGSEGQAVEAGIRAVADDQASVLVSAVATVHNTRQPQGETVRYRVLVGLQVQDAEWLVSRMEFLP